MPKLSIHRSQNSLHIINKWQIIWLIFCLHFAMSTALHWKAGLWACSHASMQRRWLTFPLIVVQHLHMKPVLRSHDWLLSDTAFFMCTPLLTRCVHPVRLNIFLTCFVKQIIWQRCYLVNLIEVTSRRTGCVELLLWNGALVCLIMWCS